MPGEELRWPEGRMWAAWRRPLAVALCFAAFLPTPAAAAAAAKSLQSCPTLCDPIDGSPRLVQEQRERWLRTKEKTATLYLAAPDSGQLRGDRQGVDIHGCHLGWGYPGSRLLPTFPLDTDTTVIPNSAGLNKAMVFPVVMYGCESWTIKKAERRRMDAFELWCWRRLLRVPWTARRSNQFFLKDFLS